MKKDAKYFKSKVEVKNEVPFGKFFDLNDKLYDELREAHFCLCKWCGHVSKEINWEIDNDKWVCPKCKKRGWHSEDLDFSDEDDDT